MERHLIPIEDEIANRVGRDGRGHGGWNLGRRVVSVPMMGEAANRH
jgi:hypothetical protein